MKSKITIEFEQTSYETGEFKPVILLKIVPSDDVRDKLLAQFVSSLKHESELCSITCNGVSENGTQWTITPIPPDNYPFIQKNIDNTIKRLSQSGSIVTQSSSVATEYPPNTVKTEL